MPKTGNSIYISILLAITMMVLWSLGLVSAQTERVRPECPPGPEEAFAGGEVTWAALHSSFNRYGHCDDGALAEIYSDFVVKTLAKKWTTLNELNQLTSMHSDFRSFVLRHINATTETNDLKAALVNSKLHCPAGAESLCAAIAREAQHALDELRQLGIH
jgi:hypothetical protein